MVKRMNYVLPRRKKVYRKKRVYRRKAIMYRRPREGVLNIKRKFHFGLWQPNTTTTNGFWRPLYISLSQIPNYTEFTALFDNFKISAIKYTLMPNYTAADANQIYTGNNILNKPQMAVCYDKYSTQAITGAYSQSTWNTFAEQGKIRIVKDPLQPIQIYISRPTVNMYTATGTGPNYQLKPCRFLSTDNYVTTNHYGPQVFISDPNFSGNNLAPYSWDIYVTVYMQVKNQK